MIKCGQPVAQVQCKGLVMYCATVHRPYSISCSLKITEDYALVLVYFWKLNEPVTAAAEQMTPLD